MIKNQLIDARIAKYMSENSIRLTPVQKKLLDQTMSMGNNEAKLSGSPDVCQLIQLWIKSTGAKRILEAGCLTGVTTVACALALPADGQITTIDITDKWINQVKPIWKETGCDQKIQVRMGDVGQVMDQMITQGETGKWDMVILDCDHKNMWNHVERALNLVKPRGMIWIMGTLWNGHVTTETPQDEETKAIKEMNRKLRDDKRIDLCMLPINDGVTLCLKRE